jgi:hypothetical protein
MIHNKLLRLFIFIDLTLVRYDASQLTRAIHRRVRIMELAHHKELAILAAPVRLTSPDTIAA